MTLPVRFLPLFSALSLSPLVSCEKQEAPAPAPPAAGSKPTARTLPAPSSVPGTPTPEPSPIAGENAGAVETTPALENFKTEMTALKAFMDEQGQQESAQSGMAALKEIIARAKAVKTEGLPDDLRDSWEAMTIVMTKMETELESLPVPADQLEEYFADQVAKNPAGLAELQPKLEAFQKRMEQIGQEGKIASANLRDTAQKYGIEGIDLGN